MTPISPEVREMTLDEQVEYGLSDRGLVIHAGECVHRLTVGSTDTFHVYLKGTVLYVLTVNVKHVYVALDWYQGKEAGPVDSLFLQGDHAIRECVGNDWRALTLLQLAERLSQLFA